MGSRATYRSTNRKQIPKTADEEKRIQTRGCVQGTFCPPISRAIKKLVMVTASVTVPGKSTRLSFRFSDRSPWPGKSFWGPSSFQTTKIMATSASGDWMRNDLGKDQYPISIFPKDRKPPPSPTDRITQISTNWTPTTSPYRRCNVYNASPCRDVAQRNRICTELELDSGYLSHKIFTCYQYGDDNMHAGASHPTDCSGGYYLPQRSSDATSKALEFSS